MDETAQQVRFWVGVRSSVPGTCTSCGRGGRGTEGVLAGGVGGSWRLGDRPSGSGAVSFGRRSQWWWRIPWRHVGGS